MRKACLVLVSRLLLTAFAVGPIHAFVFYPVGNNVLKWNTNSTLVKASAMNPTTKAIRYYIATDAYSSANRTNEINAVRACFDQWQSIPGAKVRFEFMGLIPAENLDTRYDNTNVVFWAKKSVRVNAGLEDLTNRRGWTSVTYATDGSIVDADIVLNGVQYQWFTNPDDTVNQAQYVESIVLHEIGHLLGLDHTPAGGATVVDGGNGINTNAGLSADEVAAARYLYPEGATNYASIRGTVRMNGAGILGAAVIAEDSAGNIAGTSITQASGSYAIYSLAPGTYNLRVTPLDPSSATSANSLFRVSDVAADYTLGITSFLATTNLAIPLKAAESRIQDVNVTPGNPPVRIISLSKPATQLQLVTVVRFAVSLTQGQSNYFVGVNSPGLQAGATLSVTGDGLTVGQSIFLPNQVAGGLNSLLVPVSVSSNATPGLRSLVVSQNGTLAYANGYLEIAPTVRDDNFDSLDDKFQRKYWPLWTSPDSAPTADPDNDGFSNRFEFRTGSNPTNALSYTLVLQPPIQGRFGPQMSWLTDPGKRYQLYSSPQLVPAQWQPIGEPITTLGEIWSVPLSFDLGSRFYRLELKR